VFGPIGGPISLFLVTYTWDPRVRLSSTSSHLPLGLRPCGDLEPDWEAVVPVLCLAGRQAAP
jgi:hypothetical protein